MGQRWLGPAHHCVLHPSLYHAGVPSARDHIMLPVTARPHALRHIEPPHFARHPVTTSQCVCRPSLPRQFVLPAAFGYDSDTPLEPQQQPLTAQVITPALTESSTGDIAQEREFQRSLVSQRGALVAQSKAQVVSSVKFSFQKCSYSVKLKDKSQKMLLQAIGYPHFLTTHPGSPCHECSGHGRALPPPCS